ncbi:MAG: hypothetical protein OZ921_03245 [Sorangiineae bacterium]|nr:hypothetical protein [Polyangiaceae bacterium]MEB2321504.1 hypothetical protein [Sorangiineae bacterium]
MASSPPPGYADPSAAPAELDHGRPLALFAVLFGAGALGAGHHVAARLLEAHLGPGFGPPLWVGYGLFGAGIALGAWAARRSPAAGSARATGLLAALALVTGAAAPGLATALTSPPVFDAAALGLALIEGALLGATALATWRLFGPVALALGALVRLLEPFRLLGVLALLGGGAALTSHLDLERSGLFLALALAGLAVAVSPLAERLLSRRDVHARAARAAALATLLGSAASLAWLEHAHPRAEARSYPNPILYQQRGARQEFTLTSGQGTLELYVNGKLAVSELDGYRYFEALVHPAMLSAARRARVLVLGAGDGMAERELLRYPEVESVTVVTVDAAGPALAKRLAWLRHASADSLRSPKVRVLEAEPIVWLGAGASRFDVIIAGMFDPDEYLDAKNFTREFFRRLARRLAPGGAATVQATSPFVAPRTYALIGRTLAAAGLTCAPYHAAVTTFGDWGFFLCGTAPPRAHLPPPPAGLRYLDERTLSGLFVMPRDLEAPPDDSIITLDDQRVIELFAAERRHVDQ